MQPKHFAFYVFLQMQKHKYENKDRKSKSSQNLSTQN